MTAASERAPLQSMSTLQYMSTERLPAAEAPWIDPSFLALLLVAATLFPRPLTALGAPGILNFAHFAVAVLCAVLVLPELRSRIAQRLVLGLGLLFAVMCASALLNEAGLANVGLDFLLLSEPFLLFVLLVATPMSERQLRRFRATLLGFAAVHVCLAHFQSLALGRIHDEVSGVFLGQGAGHHVGGAVALTTAAYLVLNPSLGSRLGRIALALVAATVVVTSDSKQVVAVFIVAAAVLAALRVRDVRKTLLCALAAPLLFESLWLVQAHFPLLPMLQESWRVQGGLAQKLTIGPLLLSHLDSVGNWLVGFGPGHTVGRLATLLPDYSAYLQPLGATMSPITAEAVSLREFSEFSRSRGGSSVWSPLFFWAGIFGDLGLLGCTTYLALWLVIWKKVCASDFACFLVLTILLFGIVFSWLEEPGYMLFVTGVIGIEWQQVHGRARHVSSRNIP